MALLATLAPGGAKPLAAQAPRQPAARFSTSTGLAGTVDGAATRAASLISPRERVAPPALTAARRSGHRSPLVAGFLGVIPGLGHVYAGAPGRGALVAAVWFGSGLVAFSDANTTVTGAGGVVLLGSHVFSVADAAAAAGRYNRRHEPTSASR